VLPQQQRQPQLTQRQACVDTQRAEVKCRTPPAGLRRRLKRLNGYGQRPSRQTQGSRQSQNLGEDQNRQYG
ncbi:uncharacterized protein METZ01_LOCUS56957, partial [marine metagenome]